LPAIAISSYGLRVIVGNSLICCSLIVAETSGVRTLMRSGAAVTETVSVRPPTSSFVFAVTSDPTRT